MTMIEDIVDRLVTLGYATALGTDVWPYRFPVTPYICKCIIPMSIKIPDEEMGGDGIDYPGFQVQVRHTNESWAAYDAESIRLALNNTTVGNYTIFTTRSCSTPVTSAEDLIAAGGPLYRHAIDFETIKTR